MIFLLYLNGIVKNSGVDSILNITLDKLKKIIDSKGKETFRNNFPSIDDVESS